MRGGEESRGVSRGVGQDYRERKARFGGSGRYTSLDLLQGYLGPKGYLRQGMRECRQL